MDIFFYISNANARHDLYVDAKWFVVLMCVLDFQVKLKLFNFNFYFLKFFFILFKYIFIIIKKSDF